MSETLLNQLIGADFGAVCAQFGAPLACRYQNGALWLTYDAIDGRCLERAVQVVDGVVVAVAEGILRSPIDCCGQALVGQPVESAFALFGRPSGRRHRGQLVELDFDRCTLCVHDGVIAGVSRRGAGPAVPGNDVATAGS